MSNTPSLLPCPFCGGDARLIDDLVVAFVECSHCGATGSTSSYHSGAIAVWNRRAPQPVVREPQWIDPNDKTQKQYLPHIGEPVLFCHQGKTYYGKHTGGDFVSGVGFAQKHFNTWRCHWMYPPSAHGITQNGGKP